MTVEQAITNLLGYLLTFGVLVTMLPVVVLVVVMLDITAKRLRRSWRFAT